MGKALIGVTENGKRIFIGVSHIVKVEGSKIFLDCCINPKTPNSPNTVIHTDQTEEEMNRIIAAAIYEH